MSELQYCKVSDQGIAHLFRALDFGGTCACGRKVFAFSLQDETPVLRDSVMVHDGGSPGGQQPAQASAATQGHIARGKRAIAKARRVRQSRVATRGMRSVEVTRAARPRGEALRARAREMRRFSAARRGAGRRAPSV